MPLPLTPEFVGVTTLQAHVKRAIEFMSEDSVYFVLGRMDTGWDDEADPPDPDPEATEIEEVLGYKYVGDPETNEASRAYTLVVPDEEGLIECYGITWTAVAIDDAYTSNARHVYLKATFSYDELPLDYFRQIGLVTGLVRDADDLSGNPGRVALEPGVSATQTATIASAPILATETFTITIGGTPYVYTVVAGDLVGDAAADRQAVAVGLRDLINADAGCACTATASGGVVTATAKLAGASQNDVTFTCAETSAAATITAGAATLAGGDGHVADPGVLEYLYNDIPVLRAINKQNVVELILTF